MKPPVPQSLMVKAAPLAVLLSAHARTAPAPVAEAKSAQAAPVAAPAETASPKPAAPAKPEVKDDAAVRELTNRLRQLTFDRSPQALIQAAKERRKEGEADAAEAFRLAVLFGDWGTVKKTLARVDPKDGKAVFDKLLVALAEKAVSVGVVLKQPDKGSETEEQWERQNRLQREREELKQTPVPLLSEDLLALVDAAPANLEDANIEPLSKLVKTALGEGGKAALLKRLEQGWRGVGGDTGEGRKLAAKLLSSLGWIRDAGPYLPLSEASWDAADSSSLIYAMEYFTVKGVDNRDERLLRQAAAIAARLLRSGKVGNYTRPQFRPAMDRLIRLLPALDPEAAKTLIREQLFDRSGALADLVGIIAELGQAAGGGKDLNARKSALGTQRLLMEALVQKEGDLPPTTAVLVMNWLKEAEVCYRAGGVVADEMSQADRMLLRRYGMNRDENREPTLSTSVILDTAPPRELLARLNKGLSQRVELTLLKVGVLVPDQTDLSPLREYVKKFPGSEREVCQDVLAAWVSKRTKPAENEEVKRMRAMGWYVPPQLLRKTSGNGIPLTRLRQNQNIRRFKDLLAELRQISPEPLDSALIVQSFMTLHSGAEVYRAEDIETIFGPPEKMVRRELLELIEGMRERLSQEWRNPKSQQQAGTNRTEKEVNDEVSRGYRTAMELARRGVGAGATDWEGYVTRGRLFFDASQYEQGRNIKLSEYVSLREEALASFRKAAEVYGATVPALPKGQWTIEPYYSWFIVTLGASDLARLSSSSARIDPSLGAIGDALRALPAGAAEKHQEMFIRMIAEQFPKVNANMRQMFLGSGLSLVGRENPAAAPIVKSLDYYRELLDEVGVRVKIDGPAAIGHGKPFGLIVSIESSRQLLRESGGFGRYLMNMSQSQMYGEGDSRNLREEFEKNIRAALDENFEIESIAFHNPVDQPFELKREGWVSTPAAYLVLKAKRETVDRIPSIRLDMDFTDQPGDVVLPVMSNVETVSASAKNVPARPCDGLTLAYTLDQREWKNGKLTLEIQANAKGVIPGLSELTDWAREGFETEVVDSQLNVQEYATEEGRTSPKTERNWQVTYRRKEGAPADTTFRFPTLRADFNAASATYRHYAEADLVEIDAKKVAAGVKLTGAGGAAPGKSVWVAGGAALVLALAGGILVRRKREKKPVAVDFTEVPENPGAFATVAFLRRLRSARSAAFDEARSLALDKEIAALEARHFGPAPAPAEDFSSIIRRWLDETR